jgi:hypothetical protein
MPSDFQATIPKSQFSIFFITKNQWESFEIQKEKVIAHRATTFPVLLKIAATKKND